MNLETVLNFIDATDFIEKSSSEIISYLDFLYQNRNTINCWRYVGKSLFNGFKLANMEKKNLIICYIFKLSSKIDFVEINVLEMIKSKDQTFRKMGLKIIKKFWSFYEFDEVVIFHIRKEKSFRSLLLNNSKYAKVFRKILNNNKKFV